MKTLVALTVLTALATACTTPCDEDAKASSDAVTATAPSYVILTPLSDAAREAKRVDFLQRNGGDWQATSTAIGFIEKRSGCIDGVGKTTPAGPTVSVTADQASATAKAFAKTNADLLGLEDGEFETLDTSTYPSQTPGLAFQAAFTGHYFPRGFEQFSEMRRTVWLLIDIGVDGDVHAVHNATDNLFPNLSLATTPSFGPHDPQLSAHIVGLPLATYEDTGETIYVKNGQSCVRQRRHDIGVVTTADVDSATLSIQMLPLAGDALSIALVYRVGVAKGPAVFGYTVDAVDGEVREQPAQYGVANGTFGLWREANGALLPGVLCD